MLAHSAATPWYLFFNLFHGGRAHGEAPDRLEDIANWVTLQIDVAAFSELNGSIETAGASSALMNCRLALTFLLHEPWISSGLASAFPLELAMSTRVVAPRIIYAD